MYASMNVGFARLAGFHDVFSSCITSAVGMKASRSRLDATKNHAYSTTQILVNCFGKRNGNANGTD